MKRDKVITGGEELVCRVIDKYHREDVELSSQFFDVHVRMPKKEILKAYAKCQEIINGDEVVRVEDGVIQDELVPEEEQFDQVYDGSCMEFLAISVLRSVDTIENTKVATVMARAGTTSAGV